MFPTPVWMNRRRALPPGAATHVPHTRGDEPGLETAGYDYALNADSVRHIAGEHGNEVAEAARGQRAVIAGDYARLPELLSAPDTVEDDGASGIGRPIVRYGKVIGGETITAAFEVRGKRKTLALQSMWIRPGASPR